METRELDGKILKRLLEGGANEIRQNMKTINDLNVFPVPDGDTGTNMSHTIESGIERILSADETSLGEIASSFAKGSLLGARGNSGVILSQFFAGLCYSLADKLTATPREVADAYIEGVKRSYEAVAKPVEGTILTVLRESAEYAREHMGEDGTIEEFLHLHLEQAERTLQKTKEMLPVLTEADVVDSGGAGYLCIAKGMYETLLDGKEPVYKSQISETKKETVNYDLFTTDTELEFGYCTECLVRIQRAKINPEELDEKSFVKELEELDCNSIVALRDGDILKVHAHTMTPSDVLILCQRYGEFLNVKIENMTLQHSETEKAPKKIHKPYGIVTVATGEGMVELFKTLGADYVINGGQTGNPSAEEFIKAFKTLDVDNILVMPNNSNILLTAIQAKELWELGNVTVIPTKTLCQGYSALSVFNASITDLEEQIEDITSAMEAVVSGEITVAIRDTTIGGIEVKKDEYIGILDGKLASSRVDCLDAICEMLDKVEDIDDREILTLFVGAGVTDDERVMVTEALEERYPQLSVDAYIGGQEIYQYLISIE
ncbi:MAG: DAK2 domain-containing protein [Clostridia bacterium]|nr:DAK2 domain-containing protein [Clostridia bacterium]